MVAPVLKIAVAAATFAIDRGYSYRPGPSGPVPEPGQWVVVPFGLGNRRTEGIILSVDEEESHGLKCIDRVLTEMPRLTDELLHLALFLRSRYFCTFFDGVRAIYPAGLWMQREEFYILQPAAPEEESAYPTREAWLVTEQLRLFHGQTIRPFLEQAVPDEGALEAALSYLKSKKWVQKNTDFLVPAREKTRQVASLAVSVEETLAFAQSRPRAARVQRAVLELLCAMGSVPVKELTYYTGATSATYKRLAEMGYLILSKEPVERIRKLTPAPGGFDRLTPAQAQAEEALAERMESPEPGVALLHGVTGSGKTAVYLRLIRRCLDSGRSAVLLVPEIALTPQLLGVLAAEFGELVAVLHSSLPAGERYDQWNRIQRGEARVVAGTRSAVFAPCVNPGLYLVDEEQEHTYFSENAPRYSAREVAIWRGHWEKALVVLGSATPSLESMYHAQCGDYLLCTLPDRFGGRPLPRVEMVDMRKELEAGNDTAISRPLQEAIRQTVRAGKQTILFLNRRGNSRALVCVQCGQAPECPRCSARLTYHSVNRRMMCHYCGHSQSVPERCPRCGGALKPVGTGTQKVEEQLHALFPELEIARMDADTVSAANSHEKILEHFQKDHVPILVGTQMVAKGLNLPDVTLVGVLDGDLGLYNSSYRAAEETFDMLTQVVGRCGRGDTPGRAMIQTLSPEHRVLNLAARQDYNGFYALELELRRAQGLPPFLESVSVVFTGRMEQQVLTAAGRYAQTLAAQLAAAPYRQETCQILGPAPCPVPRINLRYRYRLTLRCRMTRPLRELVAGLLRRSAQDRELRGVTGYVDLYGFD